MPSTVSLFDVVTGSMASAFNLVYDRVADRFGFGVTDVSELVPARITVAAPDPVVGSELLTNRGFVGNANGWQVLDPGDSSLHDLPFGGWAYNSNKCTYTPGASPATVLVQAGSFPGSFVDFRYLVGANVVGGTAGSVQVGLGVGSTPSYLSSALAYNSGTSAQEINAYLAGTFFAVVPTADFNGSVTALSSKAKTAGSALSVLNEDGTLAITIVTNTSAAVPGGASIRTDSFGALILSGAGNTPVYLQDFVMFFDSTRYVFFNGDGVTSTRTVVLQNTDGTMAFLADIPTGIDTYFAALPTSDPHVAGKPWNSAGTVKVSAG